MIRVLSDLHLGHSATRISEVAQLAPLLVGCEQIVFAGDIWQERKTGHALASEMLAELQQMVGDRGVFLRGNHDPHTPQGLAWLAEKKVLVTHGDAVYRDATPWSREMPEHREEVREIVERYEDSDAQSCSDRAREIALALTPIPFLKLPAPFNFFASALWPPSRPFEMIRVWRGMGEECHRFLARVAPETFVLICGHFHQTGIWEKEGRLVINTGSFMRASKPWCVDLEDDWITVRAVEKDDHLFQIGKVIGRWRLGSRGNGGAEKALQFA